MQQEMIQFQTSRCRATKGIHMENQQIIYCKGRKSVSSIYDFGIDCSIKRNGIGSFRLEVCVN